MPTSEPRGPEDFLIRHPGAAATPWSSADEEPPAMKGPPTAPLPKSPMSRTTRVVLIVSVSAVFMGLVGGGVVWMTYLRNHARARSISATNLYQEATELFKDGKFLSALEKFDNLLKQHGNTIQGRKATILAPMCRAHLAVQQREWDQGQHYERSAREAAETLYEKTDDEVLADWVRQRLGDIENMGKYRFSANEVFNAMQAASTSLSRASKESDFDRIREDLEDALGAGEVILTPQEESEVAAMRERINRRKIEHLFEADVNRGVRLLREKQYDQAEAAFQDAAALVVGQNKLAEFILPEKRRSMLNGVKEKLWELKLLREQDKSYLAISKAEKQKDTGALKEALKEALKLTSLSTAQRKAYEKRLRDLEVGEGLTSAKKFLSDGNFAAAKDVLNRVLEMDPSSVQTKSMLVETEKTAKQAELIKAGDEAFGAGDLPAALKHYRQADKNGSDEALKEKITDCEYSIELQNANDLTKAGKYNQAAAAYQKAKRIKPANEAQIEAMLVVMRNQRDYNRLLGKGDEAMKKNEWREAIRWYNQAKQVQDGQEINDRVNLTYYKKHVIDGKEAIESKNWPVARWNFKQALKYKETPEARALLKQAIAEE